ncbi:MAG: MotA/TolQ/ExbB proton channel family protein [Longimicrobiales bacterium]
MATVQCPKCGTATEFPADACGSCGTSLEGLAPAPDDASAEDLAAAARASADAAAVAAAGAAAQVGGLSGGGAREKRAKRPNSALEALLPVATALLLSLALQFAITNVVGAETYIYRLFRPPGGWVMSLVPGLIVFVLVWTLTDLALKYRQGAANDADLDRREVRELPRLMSQEPVGVLQRRLLGLAGRERPVARRLLWLLHYLESNADPQRTHELLRHQSDLDADTAAAGYRTVKLFIWAMPILGFVGTVLGISLAVGGFSEFLTTNLDIEDVSRVTAELGNVASGLSFAFDTTLLGLLAGLVANVTSSAVQKRDERFFTRLDELGLSIVANRQDAGMASAEVGALPVRAAGPEFEQVMRARIDEIDALVDRTRQVMQGLSETSARMNAGLQQSMESVRRTVDDLSGNLSAVSTALEADSANQASIEEAIGRLSDSLGSFGEGLAELRAEQKALGPVLEQLAGPLELRLVPGRKAADED